MTNIAKITAPIDIDVRISLEMGSRILLSGKIYAARDAAHKRIAQAVSLNEALPFEIKDSVIFYAGPAPAKPGHIIGPIGPTTSGRMDAYTPLLLSMGLGAMIGKGARSSAVIEAMKEQRAVYFGAVGGAAVLLSKCVRAVRIIAYEDLGPEAVLELIVEDLPLVVAIDAFGKDIYRKD